MHKMSLFWPSLMAQMDSAWQKSPKDIPPTYSSYYLYKHPALPKILTEIFADILNECFSCVAPILFQNIHWIDTGANYCCIMALDWHNNELEIMMMHNVCTVTYYFVLRTPETVVIHEIWAAIHFQLIQDPMEVQIYIQGTDTVPLLSNFEETGSVIGEDNSHTCKQDPGKVPHTARAHSGDRIKFMDCGMRGHKSIFKCKEQIHLCDDIFIKI